MRRERKHIRLRHYSYASEGAYFITICTKGRCNFFGKIAGPRHGVAAPQSMALSEIGKMATQFMKEIPDHFAHAEVDEFIVMPDHIHCILVLNNLARTRLGVSAPPDISGLNQFSKPVVGSVSVIIGQFKASVKRWCNQNGYRYFEWHSRFHDHIIRNEEEYKRIKQYIISNPKNWGRPKKK